MPSSTPIGMLTVSDSSLSTTPVPLHAGQGSSMITPCPRHSGHSVTFLTITSVSPAPFRRRLSRVFCPVPWHDAQRWSLVPSLAPVPRQAEHVERRTYCTFSSPPETTRERGIESNTSMFLPRGGPALRRPKKRSKSPPPSNPKSRPPKSKLSPPNRSPKSTFRNSSSSEIPATPAKPRASYALRLSGSESTA